MYSFNIGFVRGREGVWGMDGPFDGFFFPTLDMDRFRKIRRQH